MGKLHELLAVEGELDNVAKKIVEETTTDFNKRQHLFVGYKRTLEHLKDGYTDVPEEYQKLSTTVKDRLDYTFNHVAKLMDATYQKERANTDAKADITIGDTVIAKDVPATFLLNLEKRLAQLRPMLAAAPTMPQGVEFESDPSVGENVFKTVHPEVKMRTAKTFRHKVLYEATKEHPAQIEKWEETEDIGRFVKQHWMGMITSYDKSQMLNRIDELIRAVKQARQRANTVTVTKDKIGKSILDFVLG